MLKYAILQNAKFFIFHSCSEKRCLFLVASLPVHTFSHFLSICTSVLPRSQLVTAHNNCETVPKFGSFILRETLLAPSLAWWDLEKCKSAIELVLSATFFQSLLQLLLLRFSTARETSTATAIELVLSATFFQSLLQLLLLRFSTARETSTATETSAYLRD